MTEGQRNLGHTPEATSASLDDRMSAPHTHARPTPRQGRWRKFARQLFKGIAILLILSIVGIAVLLSLLWREDKTAITLPAPTGPFPVGRMMYDWVDQSRVDSLAPVAGQKRELVVWIWYPAAPTTLSRTVDYMPAPWRAALASYQGSFGSTFLMHDLSLVSAHSISHAKVSPIQQTYPVVIMRSGIGALALEYTTLAEDLASHGYIVVGVDAPYSTSVVVFSDGRVVTKTDAGNPPDTNPEGQNHLVDSLITIWSADTRFVLDQLEQINRSDPSGTFTGKLNMQAVGIFGHSFGGATAAQFCHDDSWCKAGIDIDGAPQGDVIQQGFQRPFLFLNSDHGDASDAADRAILANIRSIYEKLPPDERFMMTIRGTSHFNFSDLALLRDGFFGRLGGATGSIDQRRGLTVTASCIQHFFDTYLKGEPDGWPESVSRLYPEVQTASF